MVKLGAKVNTKWASLGVALATLMVVGLLESMVLGVGVSSAKPSEQSISSCLADLQKSIDPESLALGGSVEASLIVSITCGARRLPVDLVIVADESYSMTRSRAGSDNGDRPTPPNTPDPDAGTPMPPTPRGGGNQPTPGSASSNEPAFCSAAEDNRNPPTATPTRRRPRPSPTPQNQPPDPLEPAGSDDLLKEEKSWVRDMLDRPEIQRDLATDRLRIAFVSFADAVKAKSPLSSDASDVSSAAGRMRGYDLSNVKAGLTEANKILGGSSSRAKLGDDGRVAIVVLLSDFQFCQRDMRGLGLDKSTALITVGFGRDMNRKNMNNIATKQSMVLDQRDLKEFINLYEAVLAPPHPVTLTQLKVSDQLAGNMLLDPASVDPMTVTITGQLLEWQLPTGTMPQTLTYRVSPQESGIWPVSDSAGAEWTDSEALLGSGSFPQVLVEVIPETATPTPPPTATPTDTPTTPPTATSTATATATKIPEDLYLPLTVRNWPECIPEEQTIDVALVIDTSLSMHDPTQAGGKPKLTAAIDAALEIVNLLKPTDQAAIIGFNAVSHVASQLSSDKAQLTAALQTLPATSAAGTIIDSGLQAATEELTSVRHTSANKQSIILVTDGVQSNGDTQRVLDWAATAKRAGITVITVGLGTEIDEDLLRKVASDPSLFYPVPDAADLQRIYREVARIIPCP